MPDWILRCFAYVPCFVALSLLVFNLYYFFIRREVGVAFYIDKFVHKAKDAVLLTPEYKDLVDEYYRLNQELKGKPTVVFSGR